ncbi:MAG: FHA domain-containing protein [Ruminococcus sp.]|nr:FHA domain-containing protein [Ruminococcus sp.]
MKLVRCPENHYFDSEKFKSCPDCRNKKYSHMKYKADSSDYSEGLGEKQSDEESGDTLTRAENVFDSDETEENQDMTLTEILPESAVTGSYEDIIPEISLSLNQKKKLSLSEEVEESSCTVYIKHETEDDEKTVSLYHVDGKEPVVGWLVGVKGVYFGESFNLKAGQNFIGRAVNMNIKLSKDNTVSRQYHAGIIFDPETVQFFITPGQSNGLTYLNGQLLLIPTKLEPHDTIRIGKGFYMFMPFCDNAFSWDTYLGQ